MLALVRLVVVRLAVSRLLAIVRLLVLVRLLVIVRLALAEQPPCLWLVQGKKRGDCLVQQWAGKLHGAVLTAHRARTS